MGHHLGIIQFKLSDLSLRESSSSGFFVNRRTRRTTSHRVFFSDEAMEANAVGGVDSSSNSWLDLGVFGWPTNRVHQGVVESCIPSHSARHVLSIWASSSSTTTSSGNINDPCRLLLSAVFHEASNSDEEDIDILSSVFFRSEFDLYRWILLELTMTRKTRLTRSKNWWLLIRISQENSTSTEMTVTWRETVDVDLTVSGGTWMAFRKLSSCVHCHGV